MCNRCNNSKSSNWGKTIDMDVVYTGCGGNCFGLPITPDMTLRQVLDIIVGNCQDIQGGSKWYWGPDVPTFPANDGDFYLQEDGVVWEYDGTDGWEQTTIDLKGIVWGDITGNVADQADLVSFINTRANQLIDAALINLAGQALSYDAVTKKMNLGTIFSDILRLILFNQSDQQVYFGFEDGSGLPDSTKPTIAISTTDIQLVVNTVTLAVQNNNFQITESTSGSSITLSNTGVGMTGQAVTIGGGTQVTITSNNVVIGSGTGLTTFNGQVTSLGNLTWGTSAVGPVLRDTTNGNKYRLQVVNGVLGVVVQP